MNWTKDSHRLQVPAKRYRIGELVRYSPFSRQTIHNYTIMGLIREAEWTEGGHRLYDESVFARLARIIELRKTMSLTEVRRALSQEDSHQSVRKSRPASPAHQQEESPRSDQDDLGSQGENAVEDVT